MEIIVNYPRFVRAFTIYCPNYQPEDVEHVYCSNLVRGIDHIKDPRLNKVICNLNHQITALFRKLSTAETVPFTAVDEWCYCKIKSKGNMESTSNNQNLIRALGTVLNLLKEK